MQQTPPAMTSDEVSLERGKSFVKALQELKNLRPQLYSAAEYCEKSYLHNDQKQMVLDNLKDYAVRALVNAVDHLGTVAYKLTDLYDEQTFDISAVELKVACLNQRILTCQTYTDKEGLRQQQMSAAIPRHYKHYIIPKVQQQTNSEQSHVQAKPHPHLSGIPASKTLSWLLASENSTPSGTPKSTPGTADSKASTMTPEPFHLMEEDDLAPLPSSAHLHSTSGLPNSNVVPHTFGVMNHTEVSRAMTAFKSFENSGRRELYRPPARSKSMLSVFFSRSKMLKQKKINVS